MGYIALDNPINENYKQTNDNKITANFMKTKLLEYFRFKRRFLYCCTEGLRQADVNACTFEKLVEVEVKISKGDLKREFSKNAGYEKTSKHEDYKTLQFEKTITYEGMQCSSYFVTTIPNLFYIAVPDELAKTAEEEIEKVNPKYGVIIVYPGMGMYGDNIRIYRHARPLHKEKPTQKTVMQICQRCTNELITLRQKEAS